MSKTPEGEVKKVIKSYLEMIGCIPASRAVVVSANHCGYYFMPVSNGMGVHGIPDFIGHYKGRFFAIEAKVDEKDPTALQQHQLSAINISGGGSFVVRGLDDLDEFRNFVRHVDLKLI